MKKTQTTELNDLDLEGVAGGKHALAVGAGSRAAVAVQR